MVDVGYAPSNQPKFMPFFNGAAVYTRHTAAQNSLLYENMSSVWRHTPSAYSISSIRIAFHNNSKYISNYLPKETYVSSFTLRKGCSFAFAYF